MKLIGDKAFYKKVLAVAIPMMIQNGISNFVNLLDNIMVGSCGTEQMSGVSVANMVFFIYMLTIFGAFSGPGIFGAQFYGKNDNDGVRFTFRFKLIIGMIILAVGVTVIILFGDFFIGQFLKGEAGSSDPVAILNYASEYKMIIIWGLPAFTLSQAYAGSLREGGETMHPMIASVAAVLVNLIFNYLLIYGKLGFPELGVNGAAIATTLSRFVECGYLIFWTNKNKKRFPFIIGAFRSLYIPWNIAKDIIKKGTPLTINEMMFSLGMTYLNQCYSIRGLAVVAALNIVSVASNLFRIVFMTLGNAISIIVGQLLGAGKIEEAKDTAYKMTAFSVFAGALIGGVLAATSGLFPKFYNTENEIRALATTLMLTISIFQPVEAFCNAAYFTLRSGGKTFITFIFDSCSIWVLSIPVAYFMGNYTDLAIWWILFGVEATKLIRVALGLFMMKKGMWLNNIVDDKQTA